MHRTNTLLIIIVIILLAGAGYVAYTKNITLEDAVSVVQTNTNEKENDGKKVYSGNGFSFSYDEGATIRTGSLSNGFYAELTMSGAFNGLHFYPNGVDANSYDGSIQFPRNASIVKNGKTFYYTSVETEGSVVTSYLYEKDGKSILIQNDSIIDLGSIEIQ